MMTQNTLFLKTMESINREFIFMQLRRFRRTLSRPVIIVRGKDAGHLRRILLWEVEAVGHIKAAEDDQQLTVISEV